MAPRRRRRMIRARRESQVVGLGPRSMILPRWQGNVARPTRADPALAMDLARAFRSQELLDEGRYASISKMAAGETIERGYLGSLLRLTLLAPDLIGAILDGRAPRAITLPALLDSFPVERSAQRVAFEPEPERPRRRCRREGCWNSVGVAYGTVTISGQAQRVKSTRFRGPWGMRRRCSMAQTAFVFAQAAVASSLDP